MQRRTFGELPANARFYRVWLSQYEPEKEQKAKVDALILYCQLAAMENHLTASELEAIITATEKSPRRGQRASRKRNTPLS